MAQITVAAVQMTCTTDPAQNLAHAEELVRQAPPKGRRSFCCPSCLNARTFVRSAGMSITTMRCR